MMKKYGNSFKSFSKILLEILSLMAKEMAKEEHLRQQQGKESSKM